MKRVLLHSCCAPCSTAILDYLIKNQYEVCVFFYNPNIYPFEEYEIRKGEIVRYTEKLGVSYIDLDSGETPKEYNENWQKFHSKWKEDVLEFAQEPERGKRCLECFKHRFIKVAEYSAIHSFDLFTSTLASSRWKSLEQINQAGFYAESLFPTTKFWDKNWKKGGLTELRNQRAKEFYNQNYCGCEFSIKKD